jgi:hypothetical protein
MEHVFRLDAKPEAVQAMIEAMMGKPLAVTPVTLLTLTRKGRPERVAGWWRVTVVGNVERRYSDGTWGDGAGTSFTLSVAASGAGCEVRLDSGPELISTEEAAAIERAIRTGGMAPQSEAKASRQEDVARLYLAGKPIADIAKDVCYSIATVKRDVAELGLPHRKK